MRKKKHAYDEKSQSAAAVSRTCESLLMHRISHSMPVDSKNHRLQAVVFYYHSHCLMNYLMNSGMSEAGEAFPGDVHRHAVGDDAVHMHQKRELPQIDLPVFRPDSQRFGDARCDHQ